jgi:hypothetical protein
MRFLTLLFILVLNSSICSAQSVVRIEVYKFSKMRGQQVFYASSIKEANFLGNTIDDEDRAALFRKVGGDRSVAPMPMFSKPKIDDECSVQEAEMSIVTYKDKDGEIGYFAKLKHSLGEDKYIVFQNEDVINCLLIGEGVMQVYSIHKNVTFPDGSMLVTSVTSKNRPLAVSTWNISGKATLVK